MSRKLKPDSDVPVPQLSEGESSVSTEHDGTAELTDSKKDKVWYVLLEHYTPGKVILSPDKTRFESIEPFEIKRDWVWAHTKSWARKLALSKRAEGWRVIDIFPGTKEKITHKYGGLRK